MSNELAADLNEQSLDLHEALKERYLAYALSTIMHRALPDVRDGLKPVHRRIIYAMHLLRLNPKQNYAKCARIVGDVMGKFHPHGDVSIYDALVRLAQDFSMRYPLVEGQGNFGNIDGDNAAAMRYTEARMTEVSAFLLEGLAKNAVDFRPTYNEEDSEPVVLPGFFPNILANGASGIAVGMATNIPPHNVEEICQAALYLIQNADCSVADLLQYIKGPDFPTGGILILQGTDLVETYSTGRGSFRLRAKWHKEITERNNYVIIVTEIPFQVQKNRLVTKIQEMLYAKKLPMIEDVRDESAEDIRIVIEPKSRNIDAELLMESLFKLTEFEVKIPLNMNVLTMGKVPNVLSLKEVLLQWLGHCREVLQRCSRFRLENIANRLELLSGYLIAYLNIDEVIAIIREEDDAKACLMQRFSLSENQAEAILNMRLRSLRRLEEIEIKKESEDLRQEQAQLQQLLQSEDLQWQKISGELNNLSKNYAKSTEIGARRTQFGEAILKDTEDLSQALIEKEPVTVVISQKGWIRALKGHSIDKNTLSYKEGDAEQFILTAYTTDKLLLVTTDGRFFTLNVNNLPGGRGHGDAIRILIDIENDQNIVNAFIYNAAQNLLMVSNKGYGLAIEHSNIISNTRKGKQIMNLPKGDHVALCKNITGDHIALIGQNRRLLIYPAAQLVFMRRGKGVRLQKYLANNISDLSFFNLSEGLSWQDSAGRNFHKSEADLQEWLGSRGNIGRAAPRNFPKNNKFS